jgi:hypothetical protein
MARPPLKITLLNKGKTTTLSYSLNRAKSTLLGFDLILCRNSDQRMYSRLPHNSYLLVDSPEYALLGSMRCEAMLKIDS